jgi:signal transduction histidine kinase
LSLRLRLTLTYSALVALVMVVFGVVLYGTMRQNLEAEMDRRLQVRAGQVRLVIFPGASALTAEDLAAAQLDLSPLAGLDAPNIYVQVLDRSGRVVATSDNLRGATLPADPEDIAGALAGKQVLDDVSLGSDSAVRVLSVPVTNQGRILGVLQVGQGRRSLQETMDNLRNLLLSLGVGALALSGLVGWVVAHRGLHTLGAISEQAAAIATQRDFGRRLRRVRRQDEVGRLARTIDGLLATVDDTLRTHREFVADTSHELRNPLLALRTNLELLDRIEDPEGREECVREARQQVERMSRLVADLLVLARVEAGEVIEHRPVDLGALVERIAREAALRAADRRVVVERNDPVEIAGDEDRLAQVIGNLVDNALKYTPPGGRIALSLVREDGWAHLTVADTGAGIPPEHLPHIFERFYRVDKIGARAAGGAGLGLAIVKHLTEAHSGRVAAESEVGRGSRFTVRLPLRPEATSALLLPHRSDAAPAPSGP